MTVTVRHFKPDDTNHRLDSEEISLGRTYIRRKNESARRGQDYLSGVSGVHLISGIGRPPQPPSPPLGPRCCGRVRRFERVLGVEKSPELQGTSGALFVSQAISVVH